MSQFERETTMLALPARWSLVLTQERLPDPEREPLLAHSCLPVQQKAGRQAAIPDQSEQLITQLCVAVKGQYRHAGIWHAW
jgi:hypothetical protein